jgi:hypothetical protein
MEDVEDSGAQKSGAGSSGVRARALVIAIANYTAAPTLPFAVLNDASDLAAVLSSPDYCGLDPSRVRKLVDGAATLAAIRAELALMATEVTADETVIIYFSGHGYRSSTPDEMSALVPFDAELARLPETTLPETELSLALAAIKARRLLVFLDACHAGGAVALKDIEAGRFGVTEKTLAHLTNGSGRVLIASSRADETSHVMPHARNSLFTEHLLAALKGATPSTGDGVVRVFEVFNYVAERVRARLPDKQHPIFKASDLEDNFPIALRLGGAKSANVASSPLPVVSLDALLADLYPMGPTDLDVWVRAGGDVSRLKLQGTGRSNWSSAVRTLDLGGGGEHISRRSLITAALEDYPHHPWLKAAQV